MKTELIIYAVVNFRWYSVPENFCPVQIRQNDEKFLTHYRSKNHRPTENKDSCLQVCLISMKPTTQHLQ